MKRTIVEYQPVMHKQQQLIREKLALRQRVDHELKMLDQQYASLQVFLEELDKAEQDGDEEGVAYARRAIDELFAPLPRGSIDRPLDFKLPRNTNGKTHKSRRRAGRVTNR